MDNSAVEKLINCFLEGGEHLLESGFEPSEIGWALIAAGTRWTIDAGSPFAAAGFLTSTRRMVVEAYPEVLQFGDLDELCANFAHEGTAGTA